MKSLKLIIAVATLLLLAACSKVNMDNYNKIEAGMSLTEVKALIGDPTSCSEALGIKSCHWGDETRRINVNFINDKVVVSTAENLP